MRWHFDALENFPFHTNLGEENTKKKKNGS